MGALAPASANRWFGPYICAGALLPGAQGPWLKYVGAKYLICLVGFAAMVGALWWDHSVQTGTSEA